MVTSLVTAPVAESSIIPASPRTVLSFPPMPPSYCSLSPTKAHQWRIDPPDGGPVSPGRCVHCEAIKEFTNWRQLTPIELKEFDWEIAKFNSKHSKTSRVIRTGSEWR